MATRGQFILGENVISIAEEELREPRDQGQMHSQTKPSEEDISPSAAKKRRTSLHLREDLMAEARGAILVCDERSLSDLMDRALERELERLRREHNEGRPFPKRQQGLPGGRPRRR